MTPAPLRELVAPDWAPVLAPAEATVARLGEFLREETRAGRRFLPGGDKILRAFSQPLPT